MNQDPEWLASQVVHKIGEGGFGKVFASGPQSASLSSKGIDADFRERYECGKSNDLPTVWDGLYDPFVSFMRI